MDFTNFNEVIGYLGKVNKAVYGVDPWKKRCFAYKCGEIEADEVAAQDEDGNLYCQEHAWKFTH
mgnify:CR=1 FL=1